ncbi:uncharacterized protein LOC123210917 [Mangifera indica]|uniref:uncharacterized protein LOC123210917 n=1 Tax=Mangifera indica TaxID=29780 RepID=UPI001CF9CC49|nr:uncharacterized protein LOC123210917 [Mangifera indica]XP_044485350.1 uncharacterized protein LOC123210917 [Mangifera indica]
MWSFASKAFSGAIKLKKGLLKPSQISSELSDDEVPVNNSSEEGLECPICWESFNMVENVPYVLWCGHTLCKNCVLGLQRAVVKLPTLPLELPFIISCPWCNLLSLRLVYKGNLKFPHKNYFLLWMVERMNGDRSKTYQSLCGNRQPACSLNRNSAVRNQVSHVSNRQTTQTQSSEWSEVNHNEGRDHILHRYLNAERIHLSIRKSLVFFAQLTAKLPLVIILILIILYAIPASAVILALYILFTIVFAIPSFLVLYFAFPTLDWLVGEICHISRH